MDYIIEPLIGAFIGCFTNYIAIKMLFRPYNSKKLFGKNIPFTPGIIPKRKEDIAKSIGNVVARDLMDKNEIISRLSDDDLTDKAVNFIMSYVVYIPEKIKDEKSVGDFVADIVSESDLKNAVSNELYNYIMQKTEGNIALKFIGDKIISGFTEYIAEMLQNYIESDGKKFIAKTVDAEIYKLSGLSVEEIILNYGFDHFAVKRFLEDKYKNFLNENIDVIFENIDISSIVQKKIMSMDMEELEELILVIMKKELNAIVYLGAGIGFIIGLISL